MARSAVLIHELNDGSSHLDWLLERDSTKGATVSPDDRVAVTFRVNGRPDDGGVIELDAVRIQDHRAVYLSYSGPVPAVNDVGPTNAWGSGGRVTLLARGTCVIEHETEDRLVARVGYGGIESRWEGSKVEGAVWRFLRVPG